MSDLESGIFEQFKALVTSGIDPQKAGNILGLSDEVFQDVVLAYWDDQMHGSTYDKIGDDSTGGFDPDLGGC